MLHLPVHRTAGLQARRGGTHHERGAVIDGIKSIKHGGNGSGNGIGMGNDLDMRLGQMHSWMRRLGVGRP